MALAIDYGHRRTDRPENGTLTAYAHGRQRPAVPDHRRNLTAHVAIDALRAAGERAGADTVRLCRLQDLVSELTPVDQPDALAALVQRSQRAALGLDGIWGGQFWLLQEVTRRTSS
jgi:SAM-dependent MidA family methyltransferase